MRTYVTSNKSGEEEERVSQTMRGMEEFVNAGGGPALLALSC